MSTKPLEIQELLESKDQIMSYIERIVKLMEDAKAIQADIKEIYSEAKSAGFVPKYLKQLVKLYQMDADEIAEQDENMKLLRKVIGL